VELEDLWRTAKIAQQEAMKRCRDAKHSYAEEVFENVCEEVAAGWLTGPWSEEALAADVGPLWVPSRRFGLPQGGKVRQIDDFSEYQVNAAVGLRERLELGGVNEFMAMARVVATSLREAGGWVETESGKRLALPVHEGWRATNFGLVGRTLDLRAAYKQLARRESHAHLSVVVVWNPRARRVELYKEVCLAFGATASVMAFNWVARLLCLTAQKIFCLLCVNYFDDYPSLELEGSAEGGQSTFERFLELLGWDFARVAQKRLPFASVFRMLGMELRLGEALAGRIVVANTADRTQAIVTEIGHILASGVLPPPVAAGLQGRFGFAYSAFFGRPLAPALKQLSLRACRVVGGPALHDRLRQALGDLARFLCSARPRTLDFVGGAKTAVVFTDGAVEAEASGCGGVVFAQNRVEFFSLPIPAHLRAYWARMGSGHCVAQAELLPVVLARATWGQWLRDAFVIHFTDNNSVLDSLIRGNTGSFASLELLSEACSLEIELGSNTWMSRVPSVSNIADGPSRFDMSLLLERWPLAVLVEPVFPAGLQASPE
jgi:hypothetical protein